MVATAPAVEAPVEGIDVSAFTIPTDFPESDGTLDWNSTSIVVVELHAAGETGLGYTYAPAAAGKLVEELLAPVVEGLDALEMGKASPAMGARVRNAGKMKMGRSPRDDRAAWTPRAKRSAPRPSSSSTRTAPSAASRPCTGRSATRPTRASPGSRSR